MTTTSTLIAKIETSGVTKATDEFKKFNNTTATSQSQVMKLGASMLRGLGTAAVVTAAFKATEAIISIAKAYDDVADAAERVGLTTNEFESLTHIFGTVGVSAEQASTLILKTEKAMTQLATQGTGPLAKVLAQLGSQVNITAKDFQGLSGQQGVQLLKTRMDEANISMKDQNAILDTVARGLSKISPLLAENGEEYKNLTLRVAALQEQFKLSPDQLEDLNAVNDAAEEANLKWKLATRQIAASLASVRNNTVSTAANILGFTSELITDFKSLVDQSDTLEEKQNQYDEALKRSTKEALLLADAIARNPDMNPKERQAYVDSLKLQTAEKKKALDAELESIKALNTVVPLKKNIAALGKTDAEHAKEKKKAEQEEEKRIRVRLKAEQEAATERLAIIEIEKRAYESLYTVRDLQRQSFIEDLKSNIENISLGIDESTMYSLVSDEVNDLVKNLIEKQNKYAISKEKEKYKELYRVAQASLDDLNGITEDKQTESQKVQVKQLTKMLNNKVEISGYAAERIRLQSEESLQQELSSLINFNREYALINGDLHGQAKTDVEKFEKDKLNIVAKTNIMGIQGSINLDDFRKKLGQQEADRTQLRFDQLVSAENQKANEILNINKTLQEKLLSDLTTFVEEEDNRLSEEILNRKLALQTYRDIEIQKTELSKYYADQRKAIIDQELADTMAGQAAYVGSYASVGDSILQLMDNFEKGSDSSRKRMFYATKALALASASLNLGSAIAAAAAAPDSVTVAQKFANMAAIGSAVANVISNIAGTKYTPREQGGMFGKGTYLVGEKGPEMVQFGSGGRIANAQDTNKLMNGGNGSMPITIINNTSGRIDKVEQKQMDDGRIVMIMKEYMNSEVLSPNSQFNKNWDRTRLSPRRI